MINTMKKKSIPAVSHPVEDGSVFKRNGDIVSSEFGDEESVLFNARDRRSFLLNSTAAKIYSLTDGKRNVRIVYDMITEHYSADQAQIKKDVKDIYRTFMEKGIVAHG